MLPLSGKKRILLLWDWFQVWFSGTLHMEIVQERLNGVRSQLDYDSSSVIYRVTKTNGEVLYIHNPTELPPATELQKMEEPYVKATIMVPNDFVR